MSTQSLQTKWKAQQEIKKDHFSWHPIVSLKKHAIYVVEVRICSLFSQSAPSCVLNRQIPSRSILLVVNATGCVLIGKRVAKGSEHFHLYHCHFTNPTHSRWVRFSQSLYVWGEASTIRAERNTWRWHSILGFNVCTAAVAASIHSQLWSWGLGSDNIAVLWVIRWVKSGNRRKFYWRLKCCSKQMHKRNVRLGIIPGKTKCTKLYGSWLGSITTEMVEDPSF